MFISEGTRAPEGTPEKPGATGDTAVGYNNI